MNRATRTLAGFLFLLSVFPGTPSLLGAECVPVPADLVSWYRGEHAANDMQGARHGTMEGGLAFGAGQVGQAFLFNGTDAALDLGTSFNRQVFSIAFWANPGASQQNLADLIDNNHRSNLGWVVQQENNNLNHYAWFAADGSPSIAFDLPAGTWTQVVITRDESNVHRLYLNGVLLDSATGTGPIAYDGSQWLHVGRWGGGGRYWNGSLDELDFYSRALSAAEVEGLFNAGAAGKCVPAESGPGVPYFSDFESGIGTEWLIPQVETAEQAGFTRFTGRYNNHTQTVTLGGFVPGQSYTATFDFYAIDSWDGDSGGDRFQVLVNGVMAFNETFSNYNGDPPSSTQSFAGAPEGGRVNRGFNGGYVDAVYRNLAVTFTPAGSTAQVTFRGFNLQAISDESWGVDNVSVRLTSDLANPFVVGTSLPSAGTTSSQAVDRILVYTSRDVKPESAVEATHYILREAGGNGTLGDSDDFILDLLPALLSARVLGFTFNDAPLQPGRYRFELRTTLQDTESQAFAAFNREFVVAHPLLGRIESTFNNQLETATPLTPAETPAGSAFLTAAGVGSFPGGGDTDYWRFAAEAGDRVTAWIETDATGVYPQIYLKNSADANVSASGEWQPAYNYFQGVTIPVPGDYYMAVASNAGRNRGAYTLRLEVSRGPQLEAEDNNNQAQANTVQVTIATGVFRGKIAGSLTTPDRSADFFRLPLMNVGNTINAVLSFPMTSSLVAQDVVIGLEREGAGEVTTSTSGSLNHVVSTDGVYFLRVSSGRPGWRAQYLLDMTVGDSTRPVITSISLPDEGVTDSGLIDRFTVGFSEDMTPGIGRIGLPFVTYGGHTYLTTSASMGWSQAEDQAVSYGGHLVAVNDSAENDMLVREFAGYANFWIGFSDQASEGTFTWTTGEPVTFTLWNPGEPNNSGNEDFAEFLSSGRWNDIGGGSRWGVIELAGSTDGDGDGIPDVVDAFPLDPLNGFDLRAAGPDGQFGGVDDQVYRLVSTGYASGLSASFDIADGPLQPGSYRLTIDPGVSDRVGNELSAPVVRHFTVQSVPEFISENRGNNSSGLATSLSPAPTGSGDGSWSPYSSYSVGANPYQVAAARFNGDAYLDLVSCDFNDDAIRVAYGDGRGHFTGVTRYAAGDGAVATATGDFNGDSRMDIAVANYYANTVGVYLGQADGTFAAMVAYGGTSNPRDIVAADFNGDTRLDLAVANWGNATATVFVGNGDGTFADGASYPAGNNPNSIAFGDVTGDTKLDLVAVNYYEHTLRVLAGDGAGAFASPVVYSVGTNPRWVTVGDLNADSRADVVVMNVADSTVSVLLGLADGTLGAAVAFPNGCSDAYETRLFDLNGDSKLDILVAGYGSSRVGLLMGNGDGTFGAPRTFYYGGNPISVAPGEFTGDGIPDFVVALHSWSAVLLFQGNNLEPLAENPAGSGFRTAAGRGRLASRADVDYWSFSGEAGDILSVAVETPGSPAASQLLYRIEYPDGQELTSFYANSYNGWGQSSPVALPVTGTYYIRVTYNYDYFGEYRIRVALARPPVQFETEDNSTVGQADPVGFSLSGHVQSATMAGYVGLFAGVYADGSDYFALGNLAEGASLNLSTRQPSNSGLVPLLSIHNSSGANVARSVPGQTTVNHNVPAGGEGAYYGRIWAIRPGGVVLDGVNDRVNGGSWTPGTRWTVEAWVKPSAVPSGRRTIAGGFNSCRDWGVTMQDGEFGVGIRPSGGACTQTLRAGEPVVLDQWYHVVGTCDGATANLYVNGVLKASGPVDPDYIATESYFVIGSEAANGANSFPGAIDDVRVWDRALSATEAADFASDRGRRLAGTEPGLVGYWPFDEGWAGTAFDLGPFGRHGGLENGAAWLPNEPAPPYPSLLTQYLLDLSVTDNTAARIVSTSLPEEGSTSAIVLVGFTLGFSEDMIAATVTSSGNYDLRGRGADGTLDTADDPVYAVVCTGYTSGLSAGYILPDGPLQPDQYRFTVFQGLQDRGGNGLAANYVRSFTIEAVPGFGLENRNNGSAFLATTLGSTRLPTPDGSLSASSSKAAGTNPYHILATDLNADSNPDLVVANISSHNVSVLIGNGDGTFQDQVTYPTANGPIAVAAGDLNADGRVDVVSANYYSGTITVLLGNGDGTLQTGVNYSCGANPRQIRMADLNGDGQPDVVTANSGSANASVYLGNGDGTLADQVQYPAASSPYGIAVAQVAGDSHPDLVLANAGSDNITVLVGIGDGTFVAPVAYPAGDGPREVELGDMDGDGRLDAVVLNAGANSVSVLPGQADGTFGTAVSHPTGGSDPYHMILVSLNGDARPDVAVGSYGSGHMILFLNNGDGTLGPAVRYSVPNNPIAVASGDFNRDGRQDLATANHTGNHVWVWLGNDTEILTEDPAGSGLRTGTGRGSLSNQQDVDYWSFTGEAGDRLSAAIEVPGGPGSSGLWMRVESSDGQVLTEFGAASDGWGQSSPVGLPVRGTYLLRISYNHLYFSEYRLRVTLARPPVEFETENNNALGEADVPALTLVGNRQTATVVGYAGLGDTSGDYYRLGNLGEGTTISLALTQPTSSPLVPRLAIYRASGEEVAGSAPGATSLVFDIGAGGADTFYARVLADGATTGLMSQYQLAIEVADVRPPLVTALSLPEEDSTTLLLWDRFTLSFSEDMTAATVNNPASYDLRAAGTDGQFDTADDQVYAIGNPGYTSGLSANYFITDAPLQAGSYRFTALVSLQDRAGNGLTQPYVRRFTVGDVPGYIMENRQNNDLVQSTSLSRNRMASPDGSVTDAYGYGVGSNPYFVATGDLNGDGKLDLVTANISGDNVSVLLGIGDGTFMASTPYAAGNGPIAVAVGDVNGDGRADVVSANYYSHNVSVFLGNSDGTLQPHVLHAVSNNPRAVRIADLNADSRPDLVTANMNGDNVSVLLGNGDGTFQARVNYAVGNTCYGVAVGDLNGDAKPDLVAAGTGTDRAAVLLGNGDGTFADAVFYDVQDQPRDVDLGDMDGDGRLDVVILNAGGNSVSVLRGNGDGTLLPAAHYATGTSDEYHLALFNLNADNRPDVAVAAYGSNRLVVFVNNGDGSLGQRQILVGAGNPIGVVPGDFNLDGIADLATANYGNHTVTVWLGNDQEPLVEDPVGSGIRHSFARGNLTGTTDVDYWGFSAQAGDRLSVAIDTVGNANSSGLYFRVEYPDGSTLTDYTANARGYGQSTPVSIPASGTYRVRVSYNHQYWGEYRLRVTLAAPPVQIETENNNAVGQANPLSFAQVGQTRSASVAGYFDIEDRSGDFYGLGNLSAGSTIQITQRQPSHSGFGRVLSVLNSAGAPLVTSLPNADSLQFTAPADAAYYVSENYITTLGTRHPGGSVFALAFDGLDDSVGVPIDVPESAMTVSLWFRTTTLDVGLFSVQGGGWDRLLWLSGGNIACRVYSAGTIGSSGLSLADGQWHQVVMTFGPAIGGTRVYVDGVLAASSTKANSDFTWQTSVSIGFANDAPRNYFEGVMDDVRIWDRAFTAEDVVANFGNVLTGNEAGLLAWWPLDAGAGTVATDRSTGGHDGTINGAQWTGEGVGNSVPRGLLATYQLSVQLGDSANPVITSLSLPAQDSESTFVWPHFSIGFSEDMSAATVNDLANYELRGDGPDGIFGTTDDVLYTIAGNAYARGLSASFDLPDGPLQPDRYRFTIRTGLRDLFSNPLAAPYERIFVVADRPLYAFEDRDNNTANTGTSLSRTPGESPSGSFGLHSTTAVGTSPYVVAGGRLNADAHLDLVTANYSTDNISVLLGNGDGTFQPAVNYASGNGAIHVVLADVNKDNHLDALVANYSAHRVSVFPGVGDGTFGAKTDYATGNRPNAVEATDLDGDGWLDLVSANRDGDNISVFRNNGDGTFGSRTDYPTANGAARLAFGRFNADAHTDVAVVNYGNDTYSILLGNGDGTFQAAVTQPVGGQPYSVAVADLNEDGKQDLVCALIADDQLAFLPGNGDGTFGAAVKWASGGDQPHWVQLSDINSDGRLDAVVANYGNSRLSVHLGLGGGSFQPPANYPSGGNALGTAVGDFNSDGRPDIAVVNYASHNLNLFLGRPVEPLAEDAVGTVLIGAGRGHIYDTGDVDYFTFSGRAGDQVMIGVENPGFPGSSSLHYVLYRPDGVALTEFNSAGTGAGQSEPMTLPLDGSYSVRVSRNNNYFGEYRFRVYSVVAPAVLEAEGNNATAQSTTLPLAGSGDTRGATAVGYVSANGDLDYFNIGSIEVGSTVYLNARPTAGSPLAPVVSLYDASGGYMIEAGGGRAFDGVAEVRITRAGTYYALVRGQDGTTGLDSSYRLDVQAVPTGSVSFPNLLVTSVTPPSGGGSTSGQTINFSFMVQNVGSVGTGGAGWLDRILLTANQVVGDADDVQLTAVPRAGALASGDTYTVDSSGQIPDGVAGAYYLAVQTDFGNAVNEFLFEGDNTTFSETAFNVTRPPYADLKVENLTVTGPNGAHQYSIDWTTANRGDAPANGGFGERLIVRNQTTGIVLVNEDRAVAGDFAPDATLAQSATVTAIAAGVYQVIVITDVEDDFFEFDDIGHLTAEQNTAQAGFQITQLFAVTLQVNPTAGGQATGAGQFPVGSIITVTAVPDTTTLPYRFQNWTEGGVFQSSQAEYSFVVTRARTLTANFTLPLYAIGVANSPAAGGTITGAGSYFHGSTVTLTARPGPGYLFANWTDGGTIVGTDPVLSFPALAARSLVAHYTEANPSHEVTLVTEPAGLAVLAGAGTYNNGQDLAIDAPERVTRSPLIYTFRHLRQNGTVVSTSRTYTKTFTTADPGVVTFTAVYDSRSIAPEFVNVIGGVYSPPLGRMVPVNPVPISANFQVQLQFDRSMNPGVAPTFVIQNVTVGAAQAVVPAGGIWSQSALPNDTFTTPAIIFGAGMDGLHEVRVSGATDTDDVAMEPAVALSLTVDATLPANPAPILANYTDTTATLDWSAYVAPADVNGFRVYLQPATFASVTGLTPLTRVGGGVRTHTLTGLQPDTDFFAAVVAVDNAGNSEPAVTPLLVRLVSTVPPAVTVTVLPIAADTAQVTWASYDTSALVGFSGFRLYYEESPFTSVAGLTVRSVLDPALRAAEIGGLDRTRTYYIAVVGYNRNNQFNPNVTPGTWSDPYGGEVRVDTTLGGPGQEIEIFQGMTLVNNAVLTVRAGTKLRFAPDAGIVVQQGRLMVEGTALDPVRFTSYFDAGGETPSPGDWSGVTLQAGGAGSVIRHLFLNYGRGLTVNGAGITLDAFTASRNLGAGLTVAQGAVLTTTEALLTFNETGVRQTDTARLTLTGSVLKNNAVQARGEGSNPLIATGNWWGTPNDAEIAPLVLGSVDRGGLLSQEPLLTPALGIVGGETSVGRREVTLRLACRTAEDVRASEDSTFTGVFFNPFAPTLPFILSEGGGQKVIYAQFRSPTGLDSSSVTLTLDYITAGPVIQSFSLSEGQTLGRPVAVTGQASALLGMQNIEFQVDGLPLAVQPGGSLAYLFDVRLLPDGVHRVKLLARDQSGNIATLERNVVVGITPPPAPAITFPAGDIVVTAPTLIVAGNAEPLVTVRLTRNNLTVATTTASEIGKVNFPDVALLEGMNELVAIASDSVGTASSAPRLVVLDSGAPAAVVLDAPTHRPGVGLDLNWSYDPEGERATRFRVLWHSIAFATPAEASGQSAILDRMIHTVQGLPNGNYFFAVVGYDGAGNASPLSNLMPFAYDGTGPGFSAAFGKPSPVGVGDLSVTLTANEALGASPNLIVRPPGSGPVSVNLAPGANNTYTGTFPVGPDMDSGLARLTVSARDAAGNEFNGSPAGPDLILDTTPPAGRLVASPAGPVQTLSPVDVAVTLTLTEAPKPGTEPTLTFTPPTGSPIPVTLTGLGVDWSGTLNLVPAMGSGFGAFALQVRDAVDNLGTLLTSGASLEIYNTLVPTAPNEPTGLIAQALAGGGIRLSWGAVDNAEIYRLFREPGSEGVPGVVVQDGLLAPTVIDLPEADGSYRFAVAASRRGADSTHANVVTAVSDRTPPPTPTDVVAQLAASGVRVTWTQPAGEAPRWFRIYRNDALIRTVSSVTAVSDSPPRGVANYVVAAVDDTGNESRSEAAVIELFVGAVGDLTVLVNAGQAPALTWTSGDPTTTGYNVYRNGVKLNAVPSTELSFTDSSYAGFTITQYGVRAVNAAGQESPARAVDVHRLDLDLILNPTAGASAPPVARYFDLLQVGLANATATGAVPLRQIDLRRMVGPAESTVTEQVGLGVAAGANLQRDIVLPAALTYAAQTFRVRAIQETDLGGSSVIYQEIFDFRGAVVQSPMAEIVSVEQPLAGGLAAFDVRIHNRGYADMDVVLTRNSGRDPGDVYVSVKNSQGEEVSRGYFNGALPGILFLPNGTGFMRVRPGASFRVTVPNVLVPEALASAVSVTFEGGTDRIYWHYGGPEQQESGPVTGAMNTSLRQTDYYGTLQTDRQLYSNETPIVITGQAISRANGQPVPNAELKIGFATRGFTWYRQTTTDEAGNYRYVYAPASGLSGTFTLWAAHPDVFDRLNQAEVTLYRIYANPPRGDIRMSKNDTLDFSIGLINPGELTLENVTTTFRAYQTSGGSEVPVTKIQGTMLTEGPVTLNPKETRSITLHLHADIDAPDTCTVEFTMTSAEGAAATFVGNVTLLPAVPVVTVTEPRSGYVEVSVNRGNLVNRSITISNRGLRDLQGVVLVPPATYPWMQLNLTPAADGKYHLPDIAVGESQSFDVVFAPPEETPLDYYQDFIEIRGDNTPQVFRVNVYALVTSAERGSVQFYIDNVLGQDVPNATVRLRNTLLQTELPPVYTDAEGLVTVDNLQEGRWSWQVNAPGHSSTVGTVEIVPDQTVQVTTRLSKSLVTVTFRVEPVPYTDRYEIKIEQTFETHVPAPVLVLTPVSVQYDNVVPGFEANFVVTGKNHGLIEMTDVEIHPASVGGARLIPLITYFPILRPQETIEIPYRAVYLGDTEEAGGGGGLAAGLKAKLGQTGHPAKFGAKESPQFDGNAFADCISGGFVGLAQAVIALNSLINAQYRCISDASLVRTAQGILVAFSLYQAVTMMANPVTFFGNMASCFLQQVLGGLFGGGSGSGGPGSGSGPGQRSVTDFAFAGPECFAPGTPVLMADGRWRPIEEIKVKDVVRSGRRSVDIATVTEVYSRTVSTTRSVRFAALRGGGAEAELITTDEHLFWVDGRGWAEARTLKPGEWLITDQGSRVEVRSNETRAGPARVHTIQTREDHAFYANGILVHDLCGRWTNTVAAQPAVTQEVRP